MHLACETPSVGPAALVAACLQAALPRLETARSVLRAPRIEDFGYYAEIALGPSGHHILETPSREAAWMDFAQTIAMWILRGHGLWAVEAKSDSEVLGFVLIGFEPGDNEPELGYMFRERAMGKGLAAEAARAALAHAYETLQLPGLVSVIDPDNVRSRRLAERLGAERDATAEAAYCGETLIYRYPKPGVPRCA